MPKVKIKTRVIPGTVKLSHSQFIRFAAQRSGVSQVALHQAMKVLETSIKQALSEGHSVLWENVCVFDVREVAARKRSDPKTHEIKIHPATVRVHIRTSSVLTRDVVKLSNDRLDKFSKAHPIKSK